MKRTAILIGATSGDLAGVEQDLRHWQSFLMSPYGGAWIDKKEIKILRNPTREILSDLVQLASSDDYVLVAFSGHGEVRKDRLGFPETFLYLSDTELMSERELNPRNDRCTILLDSCRRIAPSKIEPFFLKEAAEIDSSRAKELYESEVMKSEKGCTKIYAADLTQEARDENSFSVVLMKQASEWTKHSHGILDLHQAMALTSEYFQLNHPQQTPRYQGGRRLRHFPFAVNPKN